MLVYGLSGRKGTTGFSTTKWRVYASYWIM